MTTPTTSAGVREARRIKQRLLDQAEACMRDTIEAQAAFWMSVDARAALPAKAIRDLVEAGGKRLRPAFCVSGYLAAGGDPDNRVIVDMAAAIEFLHVFALVHDDILDDSSLRRGVPTVHVRQSAEHERRGLRGEPRRFGEGVAILVGDLAHVYADRLAAAAPWDARQIWSVLRTEMIVGQFLDVLTAAETSADPETARLIAVCKSGHYSVHRPLALGAAVAGRGDLAPVFEEYGVALGEAFQLRDDLIDLLGDAKATGKPVGLDLHGYKMTLLLALAMQRDERIRELAEKGREPHRLRDLLCECGSVAEVERHIDRLVDRACRAIGAAPIDEGWRDELTAMAYWVAYRNQ
jgi:geranylgeranyl diphosphate synthase type I